MMMVLGGLAAFALGYLYGGLRSRWEQQMIVQGAVANFVDTNLVRQGLEHELAGVRARLVAITEELEKLPGSDDKLSGEDRQAAEKRRRIIHDNLLFSESELSRIENTYGLSEEERLIILRYAALKEAEIRRALEGQESGKEKGKSSNRSRRQRRRRARNGHQPRRVGPRRPTIRLNQLRKTMLLLRERSR
jgi:hypothetical protein